jgi:hypothetical protein
MKMNTLSLKGLFSEIELFNKKSRIDIYRYDGYCCICYDENMEIGGLILLEYLSFLLRWYIF